MKPLARTALGMLGSLALSIAGCSSSDSATSDGGADGALVDALSPDAPFDAGGGDSAVSDGRPGDHGTGETLAPMPEPGRYYVGVAAAGGRVFVIGGAAAPQTTMATAYDIASKTWATLEPLPSPFAMPNVAAV